MKELRRGIGIGSPVSLHGWIRFSRSRSAASAFSSAEQEVRKRFIFGTGTLASSWIKKTVLNTRNIYVTSMGKKIGIKRGQSVVPVIPVKLFTGVNDTADKLFGSVSDTGD